MTPSGSVTGTCESPYGTLDGCWRGMGETVPAWDFRIANFVDDATRLGVDRVLGARLQEQLIQLLTLKRGPFSDDRLDAGREYVEHAADLSDRLLIELRR